MAVIDAIALTSPLFGDDPCGPDLEYKGVDALERLATQEPERHEAGTVIPAKDPDWTAVKKLALELSGKTRDLRVAVHLTIALLRTDAWQGFAAGLQVVETFLRLYWDGVHPRSDPGDHDSIMRTSRIGLLAQAAMTLRTIRVLPLARSPRLGKIRFRDVLIARGDVKPVADEEAFDQARVDATFHDADLAELASTKEQIIAALESVMGIAKQLAAHDAADTIAPLTEVMQAIARLFDTQIAARPIEAATALDYASPNENVGPGEKERRPGQIKSQADVAATLDLLIAYYQRYEPSSPLPVLLTRARGLVGKDFVTIVNDLIPAGRGELDVLRGQRESEAEQE